MISPSNESRVSSGGDSDCKLCTFADGGFDLDAAVGHFEDLLHDRQAETGPRFFCREVWLEDLGEIFFGNAGTRVGDFEFHGMLVGRDLYVEIPTAAPHGLQGIYKKIVEDGTEEFGIGH